MSFPFSEWYKEDKITHAGIIEVLIVRNISTFSLPPTKQLNSVYSTLFISNFSTTKLLSKRTKIPNGFKKFELQLI